MKILICGATTYGNLGDDAIRDEIIKAIKPSGFDIIATRPYPNKQLIEWADKVIIGGGGLIYDNIYSNDDAHFDYFFKMYAGESMRLKKPLALIGCGVQGIKNENNLNYLKTVLEYSSYVSLRQQHDLEFIEQLIPGKAILADDLAFGINDFTDIGLQSGNGLPKLGIIPSRHQEYNLTNYIEMIKSLSSEYEIYLFTTSYEDIGMINNLAPYLGEHDSIRVFRYLTYKELIPMIAKMNKIISARFHGMVFANNYNYNYVDVYTIGSSNKNIAQLNESGRLNQLFIDNPKAIKDALTQCSKLILNKNSASTHIDLIKKFIYE